MNIWQNISFFYTWCFGNVESGLIHSQMQVTFDIIAFLNIFVEKIYFCRPSKANLTTK